ncbi:MAG: nucleotide exchange factor GrpE [Ignavibacteriae bacterium]|nr:nucleotide exchange factor GrpE [Ignavibacteriota bacterium]
MDTTQSSDHAPDENEDRLDAQQADDTTAQLAEAQTSIDALKDQLLRRAAEFENYKRRTREEQQALVKYGNEGLVLELLAVLDDFERSMRAGKEHPDFDSFYAGVELVQTKLLKTLEARGLKRMQAAGLPFDVDYHDALLQVPSTEVEPGTILDEIEPGYMLHERVIRHAKVTVASAPAE